MTRFCTPVHSSNIILLFLFVFAAAAVFAEIFFFGIVFGYYSTCRRQLRQINNLFGSTTRNTQIQQQHGSPVQQGMYGSVFCNVQTNVGKFGTDTKIPKEPIVFVKPLNQYIPALISFFALVVCTILGETAGIHLTPVRTDIQDH